MLISSDVLVSDCHEAVDRKTAKVRELQRLKDAVVEAVKRFRLADIAIDNYWDRRARDAQYDDDSSVLYSLVQELADSREPYTNAVDVLIEFEKEKAE